MEMRYFEKFWSNTLAGSGNQSWFSPDDPGKVSTGRAYFRIFAGGEYEYSFLFSNVIDSTFSDRDHSHCGLLCEEWTISDAKCGVCGEIGEPERFVPLTFEGSSVKTVTPGMFFFTDPVMLSCEKGEYLCLELSWKGTMIPYMKEVLIPVFTEKDGFFVPDKRMPLPGMVGCSKKVEKRIAFLGDSITQGIGTEENSYLHWNARIAEKIGEKYGWWNLGIGGARATDAAADSVWLYKAKQADLVNVSLGINDLCVDRRKPEEIIGDLNTIVDKLKSAGCAVGVFTLPPFDLDGEWREEWNTVNRYIREEMCKKVDYVFDTAPVWGCDAPREAYAKYGEHPNWEGCEALAEAFVKAKLI